MENWTGNRIVALFARVRGSKSEIRIGDDDDIGAFCQVELAGQIASAGDILNPIFLGQKTFIWIKQSRDRNKIQLTIWTNDDVTRLCRENTFDRRPELL